MVLAWQAALPGQSGSHGWLADRDAEVSWVHYTFEQMYLRELYLKRRRNQFVQI
ncbi:MAG TPA: hypothetical protein VFT05_06180 [Burkholderiaceae bacterium]|nr:hypothetical protein [Burkholderiaceae bacterium]